MYLRKEMKMTGVLWEKRNIYVMKDSGYLWKNPINEGKKTSIVNVKVL